MDIKELLSQAKAAIKDQKTEQAKSIYGSILKIDPKNFEANTNLGILQIKTNSLEKGLELLKIAVGENSQRVEAWINYIKYLILCEKYTLALKIIRFKPSNRRFVEIILFKPSDNYLDVKPQTVCALNIYPCI